MYRNPTEPQPESAVSPWMASILMRRGGSALQRFALTYHQLAAMPRRWRRQLRRKAAVSLGSAALILALAGPIVAAPALQSLAPEATIVVVNGEVANVNNNKCGLIEAIINARTSNAGGMRPDCTAGNPNGPDTVSLPTNGDFVLTAAHNNVEGANGLPVITSSMTINGNGATISRDADPYVPDFRLLSVDPGVSLTLNDVTLANGSSYIFDGGAIRNYGQLQMNGCTISGNVSFDEYVVSGGGIFNRGTLDISNSSFEHNTAWAGEYAYGGAIANYGTLTVSESTFHGNSTGADAARGGAIATSGDATILDTLFTGNSAGDGGAVAVFGQALISGSTFTYNSVGYGFISYERGGAVLNDGTLVVANSTFSGNEADTGGAIANSEQLTLVNSTVTGNMAEDGGGVAGVNWSDPYGYNDYDCSQTTIRASIVSGNTAPNGREAALDEPGPYCASTMIVNGHNLFGRNSSAGLLRFTPGATDIVPSVSLNAILSPLADNGGPTMTHALPANSPALDRAPNAQCTAAPVNGVDQRGEPRNQNAVGGATNNECDVGSFERAGAPVAQLGFYLSATNNGTVGGVAFAPGDIIKFTPAGGWAMHFDASDVGITKNVSAFEIEANGNILLSLVAPQNVPGVGSVAPQDVLRFTPTSTGNTTAGSFAMALDGSANLLTTAGEKIDALGLTGNGRLALSTVGAAAVRRPDNSVLKAQDEDALGFNLSNGQWSEVFNGTAIPGLAAEDVNALWIDPATGDLYISIVGAFNLGGVVGNGRDIVKLSPSGAPGGYTPSLAWDGSDNGLPTNIDGLEMIP